MNKVFLVVGGVWVLKLTFVVGYVLGQAKQNKT
jgi:hypothetical protein